jgi:hypothetical protein
MKSYLCTALLLALSGNVLAESVTTKVLEVIPSKKSNETMVFIEANERVIWVKSKETEILNALRVAKDNDLNVLMDFNELTGNLKGAQLLETAVDEAEAYEAFDNTYPTALDNYTTSVVKNLDEAQRLLDSMDDRTKRRSQCFNRAHGWAYDMWRNYNINSNKIFVFFTRRYIEEHRYKWWFHVSPYVHVQTENGIEEIVLDRTFSNKPQRVKEWTDYFVRKTKPVCARVDKYSNFKNHQYAHDCYLILTSQYYRSPKELEKLEKEGKQIHEWNYNLLKEARKQAFKSWREYYPNN